MRSYPEYSWLESYFDNDALWLEDVISWDESFELFLSEYNIFIFLTNPFFVNAHFFIDSVVRLSLSDLLLFTDSPNYSSSRLFFISIVWDLLLPLFLDTSMNSNSHASTTLRLVSPHLSKNPELILISDEYVQRYLSNSYMIKSFCSMYDSWGDKISLVIDGLALFAFMWMWFCLLFAQFLVDARVKAVNAAKQTTIFKIIIYLFSSSRDMRLQEEAITILFFLFFLYATMMILSFDDDQEEVCEVFEQWLYSGLFYVLFLHIVKISIHFLPFLEPTSPEGRTFSFTLNQFRRDALNAFSFVMRLCTILLRFYIYETLDDVLDSYYNFVGDFDDDEYFNEMVFSPFSLLFFDIDNNDDRSIFLDDESDLSWDPFILYFVTLMRLTSVVFWSIEGLARTLLAFYIGYLILFELHTVNRSLVEDCYLQNKSQS